jgi:hypothetical protein
MRPFQLWIFLDSDTLRESEQHAQDFLDSVQVSVSFVKKVKLYVICRQAESVSNMY